jgi:hypothetical protein
MFDLFLGPRQAVKAGVQDEVEITGSQRLFRDFGVFGDYVTGMACHPMGLPMFRPDFVMYK